MDGIKTGQLQTLKEGDAFEDTAAFSEKLNNSLMFDPMSDFSRILFAERLEREAHINEHLTTEFVRAAELDANFLDLT